MAIIMKKALSVVLAVCILCGCFMISAFAEDKPMGTVRVRLNSNVAGKTESDYADFIEILSDNAVYRFSGAGPVSVSDYAGTPENGKLVAGRRYSVSYCLDAADGYVLPDALNDGDIEIECGKNVTVYAKQIVSANYRTDDGEFVPYRGLRIVASITVDGNIIQRLFGMIHDLILKIQAWSLY